MTLSNVSFLAGLAQYVVFKLSIALKLLLSVFLELTAAPAGEVIQYVPAAAHIRAEQLYNY